MKLGIHPQDGRTTFRPGEMLQGTVRWDGASQLRKVELHLLWFTRGRGMEDAALVRTITFAAPGSTETRPFALRLPDSPYSFTGQLISLVWALELVLHPGNETERLELTVAPQGREIILPPVLPKPR